MPERISINDEITVGAQPSEAELKGMADDGFRTVINLRADGEDMQPMSTDAEGAKAESFGLEYVSIPVTAEGMDSELVDRFRETLHRAAKPVLVHCSGGKRAGAFVMMDLAVKNGMTGEQTIGAAEQMGFECDDKSIAEFVKQYIDTHSE